MVVGRWGWGRRGAGGGGLNASHFRILVVKTYRSAKLSTTVYKIVESQVRCNECVSRSVQEKYLCHINFVD